MAERNPMTNPSNNQGKMLGEQWKGQDANRLTSFATVIHPQNCSNQPKPATIDLSSKDRNGTVNLSLHMCMCICIYVCMYIYIYHIIITSLSRVSPVHQPRSTSSHLREEGHPEVQVCSVDGRGEQLMDAWKCEHVSCPFRGEV